MDSNSNDIDKCPFNGSMKTMLAMVVQKNQDWWPKQLKLNMLRQRLL